MSPAHGTGRVRQRLRVEGRVQGVGFRPAVARLAARLGLDGRVANAPEGVVIEVEGSPALLEAFRQELPRAAPPGARIAAIAVLAVPVQEDAGFRVVDEAASGGAPALAPDLAVCPECLAEIRDPGSRRYRYPFTACTACGPRWSIASALPWARRNTTLAAFPLCAECRAEYHDPADRRFHAEALACPQCGPRLTLRAPDGATLATGDGALRAAVEELRGGAIIALKGLGGFQLLVDATSELAVAALRRRKQRPEKPLAVMVPDAAWAARVARITVAEQALLDSPEGPIVLVERRAGTVLAQGVAPGLTRLGLLLPTTPLHHLLLEAFARPLVCTSGNRSGEPLCTDGEEALRRLGTIADLVVDHDRPVARPVDDSLVQLAAGEPQCLRLGRGHAPLRVPLLEEGAITLALGGHLKAAPALALPRVAVVGAHVGDLDSAAAVERLEGEASALAGLAGVAPARIACDRHPEYASTALAQRVAAPEGWPVVAVQHHHAHALACLAEHGHSGPATALVWDGAGLGEDGTLWGGECLAIAADGRCRHLGGLRPFRLPGGEAAMREPRRALLGLLHAHVDGEFDGDAGALAAGPARALFSAAEWRTLERMLERGVSAPWTTSIGRLFDAVAALTGLRTGAGYEGRAAIAVQQAAEARGCVARAPGLVLVPAPPAAPGAPEAEWQADWAPLLDDLLVAQARAEAPGLLAARLHRALAQFAVDAARAADVETVALGGGCFQNRLLLETCVEALREAGFRPLWPQRIPPGDGGLALGQALVARAVAPDRD